MILVIYLFIVSIRNSFDSFRVCVLLFRFSVRIDMVDGMLLLDICWWILLVFMLDFVNECN